MFGVAISTVAGRLRMSRFEGVGLMTSLTASQMSSATSSSVPVKLSGEYSNAKSVPRAASASAFTCLAASTAIFSTPFGSVRKTTSRCKAEVEL